MIKRFYVLIFLFFVFSAMCDYPKKLHAGQVIFPESKVSYWFSLIRNHNAEFLYYGIPGEIFNSKLIRAFKVKSGKKTSPTPLPSLLSRKFWLITEKKATFDEQTSPYFLTLNIPVSENWPYGPSAYSECFGLCDWKIPGDFGLHGISGNNNKIYSDEEGSYGCIRHFDEDITYLYELLDPQNMEIRYYIEDR